MSEIKVYGASDDLIEVEGAISAEFYALDDRAPGEPAGLLAFSDGHVLALFYDDDGFWRITRRAEGAAQFAKREGTDDSNDYSDIVTLTGEVTWVVFGSEIVKAPR